MEIQKIQPITTLAEAARMLTYLQEQQGSLFMDRTASEVDHFKATCAELLRPASSQDLAKQVAVLLAHFYVPDVGEAVAQEILADFVHELEGLPLWAVVKARRMWIGEGNEKRHKRPLPGDLRHSAAHLLQPVKTAEGRLKRLTDGSIDAKVEALAIKTNDAGLKALLDGAKIEGEKLVCKSSFRASSLKKREREIQLAAAEAGIKINDITEQKK